MIGLGACTMDVTNCYIQNLFSSQLCLSVSLEKRRVVHRLKALSLSCGVSIVYIIHINWMGIFAAKLYSSDQLFDDDERPETATGSEAPLCFYEVFAQHFVEAPDAARKLLPLFLKLWSQSFASQIFSLLFYRWVRPAS